MSSISIIVPCYNEKNNIPLILNELKKILSGYNIEIILVDDGSSDESFNIYNRLVLTESSIKYIRFSRNFGHQAALKAGIDFAQGDAIVSIDADLQQPPALIPDMIKKWEEGYDIVEAVRNDAHSLTWFKRISSKLYYNLLSRLSDYPVKNGISDFRLIDKKVAEIVKQLPENNLYLRGLFAWLGFRNAYINYNLQNRKNGTTKYSIHKMLHLASCGITSMSAKPLRFAMYMGLTVSGLAFIYAIYALYIAIFTEKAIAGWTSIIISVLFLSGIQLFVLGILGEYLGKLFMENKRRPTYIVSETNINIDTNDNVN